MATPASEYVKQHGLERALTEAIVAVCRTRPEDPCAAIGQFILNKQKQDAAAGPLSDEEARKDEKPVVSVERAIALASELYGLIVVPGSIKELDSYDDRNFYFRATHARPELALPADAHAVSGTPDTFHFMLKVHNGVESLNPGFIEAQNSAMAAVRVSEVWSPRALPDVNGKLISFAPSPLASGAVRAHAIRCLPFKPAGLMGDVVASATLLRAVGIAAAKVSAALIDFDHAAAHRTFVWDLAQTSAIRPLVRHLSSERQLVVGAVLDEFESRVLPQAPELRLCVIHGDINDQNILVAPAGTADPVAGVIDFGDMSHTWLVNEVAITAAYAVIALHYEREANDTAAGAQKAEPPTHLNEVDAAAAVVAGYAGQMAAQGMALTEVEWKVLPTLIACRIAVSLSIGAYSSAKDPDNEYLKLTLLPGLKALQGLRATPAAELVGTLKLAAGIS